MAKRLLKYVLGFCLLMGGEAVWASSVLAEFVVDFYGGLAKTENSDVEGLKASVPFSGMGSVTTDKI